MVSISSGYTNFSVFKRRLFQLLIFLNVVQVQEGQDVLNRYLLFVFLCDMLVALQMHLVWASGFKSWNKRINLHSILSIFHLNCRYQKWALLFHIEFWFLLFLCFPLLKLWIFAIYCYRIWYLSVLFSRLSTFSYTNVL